MSQTGSGDSVRLAGMLSTMRGPCLLLRFFLSGLVCRWQPTTYVFYHLVYSAHTYSVIIESLKSLSTRSYTFAASHGLSHGNHNKNIFCV